MIRELIASLSSEAKKDLFDRAQREADQGDEIAQSWLIDYGHLLENR